MCLGIRVHTFSRKDKNMTKRKLDVKYILVNLDMILGATIFIIIMFLLSIQVISRYFFYHSLTWTEELSIILFLWMTYLGISSAVTYRKHLRIDALIDVVPFKVKKVLLIISDIIFIIFNTYIIFPFINIISGIGSASSPILNIPKNISYIAIPLMLSISSIKIIYDIYRLWHEEEKNIGASIPAIDFESIEREREGLK